MKGATPSQDMIAVIVGISRDWKGLDMVDSVLAVKTSNEPFSTADATELSPAV